jgi:hypothetical protein
MDISYSLQYLLDSRSGLAVRRTVALQEELEEAESETVMYPKGAIDCETAEFFNPHSNPQCVVTCTNFRVLRQSPRVYRS